MRDYRAWGRTRDWNRRRDEIKKALKEKRAGKSRYSLELKHFDQIIHTHYSKVCVIIIAYDSFFYVCFN